jgi:hypothetical protein
MQLRKWCRGYLKEDRVWNGDWERTLPYLEYTCSECRVSWIEGVLNKLAYAMGTDRRPLDKNLWFRPTVLIEIPTPEEWEERSKTYGSRRFLDLRLAVAPSLWKGCLIFNMCLIRSNAPRANNPIILDNKLHNTQYERPMFKLAIMRLFN